MTVKSGITAWVLCVGSASVIWRCNMNLKTALHTYKRKTFGPHGYVAAGPLLLEW